MKRIWTLLLAILLVGCTVPSTGTSQLVQIDYTCADGQCVSTTSLYNTPTPAPTATAIPTATPGPTATPYPLTTGRLRLEETWDPFLGPDTYIQWTLISADGPAHIIVNPREVLVVFYQPGDYILRASWEYGGTIYTTTPYTLTINP